MQMIVSLTCSFSITHRTLWGKWHWIPSCGRTLAEKCRSPEPWNHKFYTCWWCNQYSPPAFQHRSSAPTLCILLCPQRRCEGVLQAGKTLLWSSKIWYPIQYLSWGICPAKTIYTLSIYLMYTESICCGIWYP